MNRGRVKQTGFFALKLLGTVGFLWWALSGIEDREGLRANFRTAMGSPGWVGLGVGYAFVSLLANAVRWQFLLHAQGIREPFLYIMRLTMYGAFFNIASIGGAAGDAAKILLLMRRVPDRKVGVTMSVMVDHLVGFVSSAIIFLVATWGTGVMEGVENGRSIFITATWLQAGGLAGVVASAFSCMPVVLRWGRRHLPGITNNKWVDAITGVLDIYRRRPAHVCGALGASFVLSASYYMTFHAGLGALGEEAGAAVIMSVMPVVDVLSGLPISISGLGVRERTFDFMMGKLTGISTAGAVSASLIGFLFTLFWGLVGGLLLLTARRGREVKG